MTDYIDREAAIKEAEKYGLSDGSVIGRHSGIADCIASDISKIPAANVAPVRRGHWERDRDTIKCSECGFGMFPIRPAFRDGDCVPYSGIPNHCPDYGARMEVPNDD
ncbi:MAG: hypothetical protein KH138_07170 [Firmicutes bacterium]|nr:hypothetical protein [Bacillota bacterium]